MGWKLSLKQAIAVVLLIAGTIGTIGHFSPASSRPIAAIMRVSVSSNGAQANGESGRFPVISRDGRWVAFSSEASNLVPNDTNGVADVFVHDRIRRTTTRVSVASDGTQGNLRSGDRISIQCRWSVCRL